MQGLSWDWLKISVSQLWATCRKSRILCTGSWLLTFKISHWCKWLAKIILHKHYLGFFGGCTCDSGGSPIPCSSGRLVVFVLILFGWLSLRGWLLSGSIEVFCWPLPCVRPGEASGLALRTQRCLHPSTFHNLLFWYSIALLLVVNTETMKLLVGQISV